MSKPLRVGIVGASPESWAATAHLPAIARLDEIILTAVATTRPQSAALAAERFGAEHAFTDVHQLVEHPDVDLVVVSVKAPAHAPVIKAALAAGKHVFSEWPLGVNLAEATELTELAEAAGVVHAVNLQGYHSPWARFVADLVAEGRIGQVESVSAVAAGDPLGGPTIAEFLAWGTDPAAGNNVLSIMVGHTLGTLDRLTGGQTGELVEVSGLAANRHEQVVVAQTGARIDNGVPGQIALIGRYRSGALASVSLHGGSAPGPDGFYIKIAGSAGTITVSAPEPGAYLHWTGWDISQYTVDGTATPLPLPDSYRLDVPPGPAAHVGEVYREVAAAIAERREALPSFRTALRHHRVLAEVERSDRTGARQPTA